MRYDQNSKSTVSFSQIKKAAQTLPHLNSLHTKLSEFPHVKQAKVRGKLKTGLNAKPVVMLSKEERKDPFYNKNIITNDIVNKKGLM